MGHKIELTLEEQYNINRQQEAKINELKNNIF
jgi:hypothetical protein